MGKRRKLGGTKIGEYEDACRCVVSAWIPAWPMWIEMRSLSLKGCCECVCGWG